jgi:hypothetical protein
VTATLGDRAIAAISTTADGRAVIQFDPGVSIAAGQKLSLMLG